MKDIFIEFILKLLDDRDIQAKIIDIVENSEKKEEKSYEKTYSESIKNKGELENLILKSGEKIEDLENTKNILEDEIKLYKQKIDDLSSELSKEKDKNSKISKELEGIRQISENLKNDKNTLINEKENLIKDLDSFKGISENLEKVKNNLNVKVLELGKEKEKLMGENSQLKSNLEETQIKYGNVIKEKDKLSDKLNFSININNKYKEKYSELEKLYESYVNLDEKIHKDLLRVIRFDSIQLFLSSGVQWSNIEGLWSAISYKLSEYNEYEVGVLNKIFDYFFGIYTILSENYERLDVSAGDEFDEEIHTRSSNSKKVNGKIQKILLIGYKNKSNNKITKSIVRL